MPIPEPWPHGDHSSHFFIDNAGVEAHLPAMIRLSPYARPEVLLYGPIPIEMITDGPYSPGIVMTPWTANVIAGAIQLGPRIWLEAATVTPRVHADFDLIDEGGAPYAEIDALYALVGTAPGGFETFRRADVQVERLDELIGFGPRSKKARRLPVTRTEDGVSLTISYVTVHDSQDAFERRESYSPIITVEWDEPLHIYTVIQDWVAAIREALRAMSNQPLRTTWVSVTPFYNDHVVDPMSYQVFGRDIEQNLYASDGLPFEPLSMSIADREIDLLSMAQRWIDTRNHPYNLFADAQDGRALTEPGLRLLTLISTIEAAYLHEYPEARPGGKTPKRDEHQLRHKLAWWIESASTAAVPANRLNAAMNDLKLTTSALKRTDVTVHSDTEPWVTAFVQIRNGLTHNGWTVGNSHYPEVFGDTDVEIEHLEEGSRFLLWVVHRHRLKLLGCSDLVVDALSQDGLAEVGLLQTGDLVMGSTSLNSKP
jgi:hypothetical protein